MTRINVGIDPKKLNDRALIAEHREIKRVPNAVRNGRYSLKGQPEFFKLGSGHVKFFYDKLGYLRERYLTIYEECKNRGFNVTDFSGCWEGIEEELMNGYNPTERDIEIITERIKERGGFK